MDSYALILIPPKKILEFVDGFRKKYAKYTKYIIPPHMTVYPPFYIKDSGEKEIIDCLEKGLGNVRATRIVIDSVDYFEGRNNIAFFKPNYKSSEFIKKLLILAINSLKGSVKNVYDDYNFTLQKFKPHLTIAEKIPDSVLTQIKEKLGNIKKTLDFDVKSVYLYKQKGDSRLWEELKEISFGQKL